MKTLFEELERNTKALNALDIRYDETNNSFFWNTFVSDYKKRKELEWITQIKKRVLRMRYRILENISRDVSMQMHDTSVKSRELNLINA